MTTTPTAFNGELPTSLRCGFCKRPIENVFYRVFGRFACEACAADARVARERNAFDGVAFARAAAAGLVAALLCGLGWAAIVHVSHLQIGIAALFIGVAVGRTILAASWKRRGVSLQWLTVVLTVIGFAFGKVLLIAWELHDGLRHRGMPTNLSFVMNLMLKVIEEHPREVFTVFDLVCVGLAVFAGWRICRPLPIVLAGPFTYQPTTAGVDALQFDTVEPNESSAAEPSAAESTAAEPSAAEPSAVETPAAEPSNAELL